MVAVCPPVLIGLKATQYCIIKRCLILDKKSNFDKITDLFLYMAARSENIKTLKKYYHKKC